MYLEVDAPELKDNEENLLLYSHSVALRNRFRILAEYIPHTCGTDSVY